ncbi:hypothetical protein AB0O91_38280 [Kitasatospora sp. NPDC089797]|uniref:hypothetical protein n=1 Tax=Kitasatospora sp. NPDC089797 TaxID=3155298 RepID=UPI00343C2443
MTSPTRPEATPGRVDRSEPDTGGPAPLGRRSARGDEASFEAPYRVLPGPVRDAAPRVPRSSGHAGGITREVLLEAWRTPAADRAHRSVRG